jgi:lipoprotein-anchoring transpeptidase ErfK/SrfK
LVTSDRPDGLKISSSLPFSKAGFVPLFLSAAMIVGVGMATASTGMPPRQGAGQQAVPPKNEGTQGQVKPPFQVPKPVPMQVEAVPGITFADMPGITYVLARTLAERLALDLDLDKDEKELTIGQQKLGPFRRLYSGNIIVPIREIEKFSGTIEATQDGDRVNVQCNGIVFDVVVGKKRIEVDKAAQELTAYQGDVVVLKTNVSTGRPGHNTPNGEFVTGPKERMHYSHKYNDAEMPYAVQVNGDVFFHGYPSVPSYPASHGCIRMPLGRNSPAKYLFGWVNRGVDVKIFGTYSWESRHSRRKHKKK